MGEGLALKTTFCSQNVHEYMHVRFSPAADGIYAELSRHKTDNISDVSRKYFDKTYLFNFFNLT